MNYDLAIVGGGPAGSSAAITAARRGLRVVVCDRSLPARDKVCGEFVSAEALPALEEWVPEVLEQAPEIAGAALVTARGRRTEFRLPQPSRGISRPLLDAALWHAAGAAGAVLRPRTAVARMQVTNGGVRIHTAEGEQMEAGAAIVATGRAPRTGGGGWMGVKARFTGLSPRPQVELFALRSGYAGVAPVEGGRTNVCCLLRTAAVRTLSGSRDLAAWLTGLAGSAPLCARLGGATQATATVITAGIALGPRAALQGAALAAGDASGFVDPFTGDGIARAILSGRLAAEAGGEAARYASMLAAAAGPGFRTGAWLRAAVLAPAWAQDLACAAVGRTGFGPRLAAATRWRTL